MAIFLANILRHFFSWGDFLIDFLLDFLIDFLIDFLLVFLVDFLFVFLVDFFIDFLKDLRDFTFGIFI